MILFCKNGFFIILSKSDSKKLILSHGERWLISDTINYQPYLSKRPLLKWDHSLGFLLEFVLLRFLSVFIIVLLFFFLIFSNFYKAKTKTETFCISDYLTSSITYILQYFRKHYWTKLVSAEKQIQCWDPIWKLNSTYFAIAHKSIRRTELQKPLGKDYAFLTFIELPTSCYCIIHNEHQSLKLSWWVQASISFFSWCYYRSFSGWHYGTARASLHKTIINRDFLE